MAVFGAGRREPPNGAKGLFCPDKVLSCRWHHHEFMTSMLKIRVVFKTARLRIYPARPPSVRRAAEEILHPREEACRFRAGFLGGGILEFREQLTLPLGEILRCFHHGLNIEIAKVL